MCHSFTCVFGALVKERSWGPGPGPAGAPHHGSRGVSADPNLRRFCGLDFELRRTARARRRGLQQTEKLTTNLEIQGRKAAVGRRGGPFRLPRGTYPGGRARGWP
jgi:hypothetical protein